MNHTIPCPTCNNPLHLIKVFTTNRYTQLESNGRYFIGSDKVEESESTLVRIFLHCEECGEEYPYEWLRDYIRRAYNHEPYLL